MSLTQKDIMDLQTILGSHIDARFDALAAQISSLSDSLKAVTETASVENERRRTDIHALFDADRVQTSERARLETRVVALESWRETYIKSEDGERAGAQFSASQRWVIIGVGVSILLFVSEKIFELIGHLGGVK